jgi:hypothetical protein
MTLDPDVNDRKFEFNEFYSVGTEFRAGPYGGHYRHLTGPAGVCLMNRR